MNVLNGISLDDLANFASIVGLIFTIFILFNLRNVRRLYIFTARVPELLEKLMQLASKLAKYQKDYEASRQDIELELARAEVILKSLKKKVPRQTKSSISGVLGSVKIYRRRQDSEQLWKIYIELQQLVDEVKELQSDRKWEK